MSKQDRLQQHRLSAKMPVFRSLREQFLANLDPQRTLLLEELNQRLWVWIEQVYHRAEHGGLGTTPLLRWQARANCVYLRCTQLHHHRSRLWP